MIEQLNKIVQVGLNMLEKQDETIKIIKEESGRTREYLGAKIDEVSKKIDKVSERIDESSKSICDKIDESAEKICSKIDHLRTDLKSYLVEEVGREC